MALDFHVYLILRIAGSKYFAWIYFRKFTRFLLNLHRECGTISRVFNLTCTYFREKAKNLRNREILYTPIFSAVRYYNSDFRDVRNVSMSRNFRRVYY